MTVLCRGLVHRPVVIRSKQCLDYACTMYGIHLTICAIINGPSETINLPVLLLLAAQCVITVQVGRLQCQEAELLPIPLNANIQGSDASMTPFEAIWAFIIKGCGCLGRLRFCLPFLNGTIAKIINLCGGSKSESTMPPEVIPLTNVQTSSKVPSIPVTPKEIFPF